MAWAVVGKIKVNQNRVRRKCEKCKKHMPKPGRNQFVCLQCQTEQRRLR